MTEVKLDFSEEIEANMTAKTVSSEAVFLVTSGSYLHVRKRGCFISSCKLRSTENGNIVSVLYSPPSLRMGKLAASHVMSPVGPSDGIGGQHGFARWADYHKFEPARGLLKEKRVALQAKRSDMGMGIHKLFELQEHALTSQTTATNYQDSADTTSLGEHYYFDLPGEKSDGLKVNGQTLDQLLGEGAQTTIMGGKAMFFDGFDGQAVIDFPAGHSVELTAEAKDAGDTKLGMLVWHRPGSGSICFEPTLGYNPDGSNDGLVLPPYGSAALSTTITLL